MSVARAWQTRRGTDRPGLQDKRARVLAATVRLLLALIRVSGFRLAGERLPEGECKASILRAITSAEIALPLVMILRILGMSPSRYHAWRRVALVCGLDDRSPCPRTAPGQLTAGEVATVKDMVLAPEYRHMPLRTLSLYAQRVGRVFASASTWARLVRDRGWRRPRLRVHPAKPTVGVRATRPNEIWHIDVSVLRLLDGSKAYIHAIIDNFSRKILAWAVGARLDPTATCRVLVAAGRHPVPPGGPGYPRLDPHRYATGVGPRPALRQTSPPLGLGRRFGLERPVDGRSQSRRSGH